MNGRKEIMFKIKCIGSGSKGGGLMFIRCIGSGSSGNSYALYDDNNKVLLLDLGLPRKEIMKAIDFRISDVVCCLISHEHS